MRRGTRVGSGYIPITADGSGINKDIVDAVEDAGPDVEKAGDEHGEAYGERFSEGFLDRMRSRMPKIAGALTQRFGNAGSDAGDEAGDNFVKRMASKGKEAADRISEELSDRMASRPEAVHRGVERAFSDEFADRIATRFADRMSETMGDRLEILLAQHQQFIEEQAAKTPTVSGNRAPRLPSVPDGGGFDVSRLFGRGSRNNALNLFGGIVGGVSSLITKTTGLMTKFVSTFSKGWKTAAEGASFFQKALSGAGAVTSGLGGSLTSLAAALPAVAGAIIGISFVAVGLTSVLGALLGIVVALSASIATALVGALAIGAGAMGAVAAAGGLLTAAFMSMTDAQKELLTDAFRPLKAEMVGIGQLMLQQMVPAFATWSTNLQKALHLLAPVAQQMGAAFAQAGNLLTAALSGPGFQQLSIALGTFLPSIITRLSRALGGFLNGLAGLFAGILPYVNQFAGYLARVANQFSRWVNSAQGQNSIANFMDRAVVAMKSVWDFAKELTGVLTDLLFNPSAQAAGDSIFGMMTNGLKSLRTAIQKAARNGDLQKWFEDAVEFAGKLGDAIRAVFRGFKKLYDSGVLDTVGNLIVALAETFEFLAGAAGKITDFFQNDFVQVVTGVINPIWGLIQVIDKLAGGLFDVEDAADGAADSLFSVSKAIDDPGVLALLSGNVPGGGAPTGINGWNMSGPSIDDLVESGYDALNQTSQDSGGYLPDWKNPYIDWANSLMDDGPGVAAQIREAIRSVSKQIGEALKGIAKMDDRGEARSALKTLRESLAATADDIVESAQQGLNSAASALASASSPAEVQRALRQVHAAQAAVREAQRQQRVLDRLQDRLRKQEKSSDSRVDRLMQGLNVQNATLADFAAARGKIAQKLAGANQKLFNAIALREQYQTQVTDAIKAFGALTTAQGAIVDGVEQALTAGDITTNLEDRLAKIKKFQENLRLLVAQGLSNDAYQQIVDQGVEGGSRFAEALLAGGIGSIQEVNDLVGEINGIADKLGVEVSNRLYQAGVDAARGLIDGLEALSDKLDRAATRLGNSIAAAVRRALGIKSPSRVMMATMDDVGDGTEKGLDNQHRKVGRAAQRFSNQIAVSPEVAAHASRQEQTPSVSGNQESGSGQKFRDLVVNTPTEDPIAVAHEVLNEVTGRL